MARIQSRTTLVQITGIWKVIHALDKTCVQTHLNMKEIEKLKIGLLNRGFLQQQGQQKTCPCLKLEDCALCLDSMMPPIFFRG
jgi:hypothetical protein